MPQEPSKALRFIVPVALVVVGIGLLAIFVRGGGKPASPSPTPISSTAAPNPVLPQANPAPAVPAPTVSPAPTGPEPAPELLTGLTVIAYPDESPYLPLGDVDRISDQAPAASATNLRLEFSRIGAGIQSLDLASYYTTVQRTEHVRLQSQASATLRTLDGGERVDVITPMAALAIVVNGVSVPLTDAPGPTPVWRQITPTVPGAFEAMIVNAQGAPVVRLTRHYSLAPGSFTIGVRQTAENLTDAALKVRWYQFGPGDLPAGAVGYGGDVRRIRFGYLASPASDPTRQIVQSNRFVWPRRSMLKSADPYWPNSTSSSRGLELVWSAMTDRYFAVAMHPLLDASVPAPDKRLGLAREIAPVRIGAPDNPALIQRVDSGVRDLAPRSTLDLSYGVYAGPLAKRSIEAQPSAGAIGLPGLVIYTMGGMCGPCTFSFLTEFLLWLLHLLHDHVVFDWALAIMVLVLIVRGAMHPLTKWSQIRMQRFGKQMQDLGPKQKQLQEKFKDDKKQLQLETAKLWKESGVSPTGMLGCLPMLLQMPIWIALYAMLAFAVELRHQSAFFGVFQSLGGWRFMADLSAPDHVISFGRVLVTLPLLGPLESFNVLPLVLALVYWMQQKYLTPPPSANESPEMRQQRIMMKWMMVVIFPMLMYNAPCGLMLYFICNSTIAIVESRHIRAYAKKHGLLEPRKPRPGAPKRKSFLESLQEMQDKRTKLLADKQRDRKR